tara:strand:+ start:727 stop:1872 length:1146 start_codon:yes stop_codon:yes gene_type:complete
MTIKSSGSPLKFSDIANEFGTPTDNKLGNYRVNQEVGDADFRLDEGMPIGISSISFGDFYGKRLNLVVHYSGDENSPSTARSRYTNDIGVTVIGGFRSKPSSSVGTRVIIHVSANIGSSSASRTTTALNTGTWKAGTKLDIEIGSEGFVSGAGGKGGRGGNDGESGEGDKKKQRDATGQPGQDGSSALGISYYVENINVQTGGKIYGGGGGGGGSGGARNESENVAAGAGGGGGAGIPAGEGGLIGEDGGADSVSLAGGDGGATTGGAGGRGGYELDGEKKGAKAGGGGGGGSFGSVGLGGLRGGAPGNGDARDDAAEDGGNGSVSKGGNGGGGDAEKQEQAEGPGGAGGNNGYAIVITSGILSPTKTGSTGQIKGGTLDV